MIIGKDGTLYSLTCPLYLGMILVAIPKYTKGKLGLTPKNKADVRNVTVLYDDGNEAAVKGKLKPGDKVVTDGQLQLVQGTAVSIKKAPVGGGNEQQAPAGAQ